jgi:hypothetical protein
MVEAAVSVPPLHDYDAWARHWYDTMGVNVIPAKTRIKKTFIKWAPYQNEPVPRETFEKWIQEDEFRDGMAVVLGKVWRGKHEGEYLVLIDLDNLRAIDEFCTRGGVSISLKQVAEKYIVEQHRDNLNKAHVLFYSEIPFTGKSNDANAIDDFDTQFRNNEVPALEIKGLGVHGIVYCTPSVHKDGFPYEIIGVQIPEVLSKKAADEMMQHIDDICRKYGLHYLENKTNNDVNGRNISQLPIADVFNLDLKTTEGNNRHLRDMRIMESLIFKLRDRMSLDQIKTVAKAFTDLVCIPPKDEEYFEQDWKDAVKFIEEKDAEEAARRGNEELLDSCVMMELISRSPETYVAVIKKDDYHNPTTKMMQPIRAIQEIEIKREKDKETGTMKPSENRYKHIILNAIPIPPVEVIYDPLFERTKYRIRWEYVGPGNQIVGMDEPVGPFTKEELKDYLVEQTSWVYRRKLLDDTLDQIIKGYCTRKGMAKFTTEIETEGLVWLPKENRLALSKWNRYKPTPEEAIECIKVMLELQQKFYQPTTKRPFERKRLAHFIKVGLVSIVDFARRQCGAVQSHGFIPRQDLGGWSNSGKTYGYAGLALRLYRLPLYGKTPYVIGSGSVETEARLIYHTKGTTMPVILDDADFFADWQRNDQAKRCLSIMKYATENTNPRNILTQDSKGLDLPLCAFTMFTHNSDLIDEDGFIRRSTGHEFTKDDEKTLQEVKLYQAYFDDQHHSHVFGYLGDFAINYYLENPQILYNDWLTIAKTILQQFFAYAGFSEHEIPRWLLDEIVDSSTSQAKLAENRSAAIAAALHDIIQNQGWVRNKREAALWIAEHLRTGFATAGSLDYQTNKAREQLDEVMANATLEDKIKALTAINALPFVRWHDTHEVCLTAPVIEELKKHGITRVSHTQLPSYCEGFTYDKLWFGSKQQRVVYAKVDKFVEFINPSNG